MPFSYRRIASRTINREATINTNLSNFLGPVENGSVSAPFSVSSPSLNGVVISNGTSSGVSATSNVTYDGTTFSITGNSYTTGAAVLGGALIYGSETISSSGALSPSMPVSFLDISGTRAYTLANGTYAGTIKYISVKNGVHTPAGTLTPVTTSGTWNTAAFNATGQSLTLLWDGAGWVILGRQSGVAASATAVVGLPAVA
jgi:hypothetical protein